MKSLAILLLLPVVAMSVSGDDSNGGYVPKEGFVPTKEVAIKIAVAVWEPIYGADKIANEKPYKAVLDEKGVWTVTGSLPEGAKGGVAEARIAKVDARIIAVMHYK